MKIPNMKLYKNLMGVAAFCRPWQTDRRVEAHRSPPPLARAPNM